METAIDLRPCDGEAELSDPSVTGEFADDMAGIAALPHVAPWCGYVARRGGRPVGFGGFKGEPVDGTVEIGYLTFPPFEGTGVATAVAGRMVEIARASGARVVVAHTLPTLNGSTEALRRCGFVQTGIADDPDEGQVWHWEHVL